MTERSESTLRHSVVRCSLIQLQGFFQCVNLRFDDLLFRRSQCSFIQALFQTDQAHLFTIVAAGIFFFWHHIRQGVGDTGPGGSLPMVRFFEGFFIDAVKHFGIRDAAA